MWVGESLNQQSQLTRDSEKKNRQKKIDSFFKNPCDSLQTGETLRIGGRMVSWQRQSGEAEEEEEKEKEEEGEEEEEEKEVEKKEDKWGRTKMKQTCLMLYFASL